MSGAPKMLSRYIQARCTASHSSNVSERCDSFLSHDSTRSLMPITNRDASILCNPDWWSSNWIKMSSRLAKMNTSLDSRCGFTVKFIVRHPFSILSSCSSRAYSPEATPETSSTNSLMRKTSHVSRLSRVMSLSYGLPNLENIWSQCLSFKAGLPSASSVGIYPFHFSVSVLNRSATSSSRFLKILIASLT